MVPMTRTTARGDKEAAPPAAATAVVDLLNSRPYAILGDKLETPGLAADVLRPFGQEGAPSEQRIALVRAVRSDLLDLVAANDPSDADGEWGAFTGRVASITFQQDFSTPGEVRQRQVTGDPVAGRITQAVAEIVAAGNWSRLRFCANPKCREVFYDVSRSRNRRWHSYEICGNRANVAAHRARAGGSGGGAGSTGGAGSADGPGSAGGAGSAGGKSRRRGGS
jgi:predicted RNA-binding Zn ribbon-like protein